MSVDRDDGSGPEAIPVARRVADWVLKTGRPVPVLLVAAGILLLRSGFSVGNAAVHGLFFARSFPEPRDEFASWGVIGPALGAAFGIGTARPWILLQGASLVFVLAVTALLVARRLGERADRRTAMIWASLTSVIAVQLHYLRSYDIWMMLGGSLVALGPGLASAIAGGLVLGLSNAEAGALALACTGAVVLANGRGTAPRERAPAALVRVGAAFVALVVAKVGLVVWFASVGGPVEDRADIFLPNLGRAVRLQLSFGSLGVFSWYGVAWFAVGVFLWRCRRDRTAVRLAAVGLVLLAGAVTFLTTDGTRVFATITWPAYLVAIVSVLEDGSSDGGAASRLLRRAAPAALLVSLIVPAIVTTPWGEVFVPWRYAVERLL